MAKKTDVKLVVITPERQVLEEACDEVVIPAHDGELGILRDRAALMCELGVGVLRYRRGNATQRVFIDSGFAQVHDNHVTVLSASALRADEVTPERVAAAERAAREHTGQTTAAMAARRTAERRLRALRSVRGTG